MLRKILEKLSRRKTFRRKIGVGGQSASILVSPDAQLKYMKIGKRAFDADLICIAEEYLNEGDHVWDIGANAGVFSFAAALVVTETGSVLAVEADNWLADIIRTTSRNTDFADYRIDVLSVAIADAQGIAPFMIASRGRASSALEQAGGRSQMGGVRETQYVPTATLDCLLDTFTEPNFVKIDIEGAELLALRSAEHLINAVRPTWYIEVGQDVSSEIHQLFKNANYSCIDPATGNKLVECADNSLFVPH